MMRLVPILALIGMFLSVTGCKKEEKYPLTRDAIMEHFKTQPGEIFLAQGADGPYQSAGNSVGNINSGGNFRMTTKRGAQPLVTWPATPGYYYEANGYINKQGECFYIVRKIPQTQKKS